MLLNMTKANIEMKEKQKYFYTFYAVVYSSSKRTCYRCPVELLASSHKCYQKFTQNDRKFGSHNIALPSIFLCLSVY